ncbi:hypothetical protein Thein_0027 [Thermodesulfatator indicus DSM 15286]|uniref:Uncharacterized protein n=1 Tax=Thermodesulfatator indicus (strain DSM 15286 / JCM 11887 / CIR29812) TaxID=667014 RepID=F8A7Z6_THEID|nr:hypothetical protein Thein_0027 [Thermodesulfatator indicus DSM 15286]
MNNTTGILILKSIPQEKKDKVAEFLAKFVGKTAIKRI